GRAGQAVQARVGRLRQRVRRQAPPVRDVLRRSALRGEGLCVPQLRLRGAGGRRGRVPGRLRREGNPMSKPEYEFFPVTDVEFTVCPAGDPKITERILAKDPETGVATRILRYEPGADSTPMGVQKHDFWEEVYILEGSFTDLTLNKTFTAGM